MWGIAPIYFKALGAVSALEILSHRVVWSFVLLAVLIHLGRRWRSVVGVVHTPRKFWLLLVTALLVGGNWLIFIWSINANHMLDASLGYYINPLLNVLLGMLFLGGRLRKLQWFAVALAAIGVGIQLVVFGSVPIVAIVAIALATSFGFYGLLRKKIQVDAQTGLFLETLFMLPAAAIYLIWLADTPTSDMALNTWQLNLLLVCAGVVTTLPLLCFTGAAARLKLSTLGFFQYIGPSLMFLLAVLVYGEAFTSDKAITFAFIWSALVIFSVDGLKAGHAARRAR
ncbi:EamA family transporter RarD [Vibrio cholerae]|uniref:EamA family transporter RarD n=1 Tax=Vibrio cholerae TaxID=666 RepID=UPI001E621D13|nr:EamA family transporter RarD [Vibrio cholerae]